MTANFQIKSGKKKFLCPNEDCERLFSTKFNLRRHIQLFHLRKKEYQCIECGKCYESKQTLSDHINSHTGEKPFRCEICGASYKHSSKFSFHLKKHKLSGDLKNPLKRVPRQPKDLCLKYRKIEENIAVQLPPIRNSQFYEPIPLPEILKS